MDYTLQRVGRYLDAEINKIRELYFEELKKKEALHGKYFDDSDLIKYAHYSQCLGQINQDLFYPSSFERFNVIQEMLIRNNREEHNTEIVFLDDTVNVINHKMLIDFSDGYLLIFNKESYDENPDMVPRVDSLINLANVKELHTIYDD
jgi:hypothetical protein